MNDIANKDPVKRVRTALNLFDKNLKIQILENSARTALDASKALDCEVGAIVKSLVLRRKNSFLICLVSGDKKCSLNKVKRILAEKDVCLADAEQVKEISGFTIGGVSPIGLKNIFIFDIGWILIQSARWQPIALKNIEYLINIFYFKTIPETIDLLDTDNRNLRDKTQSN